MHAVAVDRDDIREALQPPLGGTQVADDVPEPVGAGRRDEAGVDEAAELRA